MNEYNPDEVSSPIDSLRDILEERGESELLWKIVSEDRHIDASLAAELESLLEIPATFWLERQRQYDEWKNRSSVS